MVELSARRDSGVDSRVSQCMEVRPQFPATRGPQDSEFCYPQLEGETGLDQFYFLSFDM
jgi:hypothetical protein